MTPNQDTGGTAKCNRNNNNNFPSKPDNNQNNEYVNSSWTDNFSILDSRNYREKNLYNNCKYKNDNTVAYFNSFKRVNNESRRDSWSDHYNFLHNHISIRNGKNTDFELFSGKVSPLPKKKVQTTCWCCIQAQRPMWSTTNHLTLILSLTFTSPKTRSLIIRAHSNGMDECIFSVEKMTIILLTVFVRWWLKENWFQFPNYTKKLSIN